MPAWLRTTTPRLSLIDDSLANTIVNAVAGAPEDRTADFGAAWVSAARGRRNYSLDPFGAMLMMGSRGNVQMSTDLNFKVMGGRTEHGGWSLFRRVGYRGKGLTLLNVDVPRDFTPEQATRLQNDILTCAAAATAAGYDAPILPYTHGALHQLQSAYRWGGGNYNEWVANHITVIHQKDLEAVFRVQVREHDHYYLSGFDTQETPPLYFLCQLPGPVATIDEAREALKPASVKAALAEGVSVKRQGDLFAIDTPITTKQLKEQGAVIHNGPRGWQLYGTNHVTSSGAVLPNGLQLAWRGMSHEPNGRRPDHAPIEWGNHWRVIMKNTVPLNTSYRDPAAKPASDGAVDVGSVRVDSAAWNQLAHSVTWEEMRARAQPGDVIRIVTHGGTLVRTINADGTWSERIERHPTTPPWEARSRRDVDRLIRETEERQRALAMEYHRLATRLNHWPNPRIPERADENGNPTPPATLQPDATRQEILDHVTAQAEARARESEERTRRRWWRFGR